MRQTRIKICGITRIGDALVAEAAGADAIGFVFWAGSRRCISIADAAWIAKRTSPFLATVGVFVSPQIDEVRRTVEAVGLTAVQLCGEIDVASWHSLKQTVRTIRSLSIDDLDRALNAVDGIDDLMLDSHSVTSPGGTGTSLDWNRIPELPRNLRLWLAGGLTAENVGRAIAAVRPFAVDVSTGVEDRPGVKSQGKIARFVSAVRTADANLPMINA